MTRDLDSLHCSHNKYIQHARAVGSVKASSLRHKKLQNTKHHGGSFLGENVTAEY